MRVRNRVRSTFVCRYRAPNKDAWPRARSAKCGAPGEPTVLAGSRTNRTESLVHRFLPAPLSRLVAPPCPRRSARPDRTALSRNRPLGSAEVIHPFHPLRGQRFVVLKVRTVSGVETLSLRHADLGSFALPRDWTDWGPPGFQAQAGEERLLVDAFGLVRLAELIASLGTSDFGVDR